MVRICGFGFCFGSICRLRWIESGIEGEEEVIAIELTVHDGGDSGSDPTFTIDVVRSACGTPDEEPEEEPAAEEEVSANIEELTAEAFYDTLGNATFHYIFYCPTLPNRCRRNVYYRKLHGRIHPTKKPQWVWGFLFST